MPNENGVDIAALRNATMKKRAQYEALKEDFEGMNTKLTAEFEKQLKSSLTPEEEDVVLGGDINEIAQMIDAKKKVYVDDVVEDKRLELEAFEDAIEKEEDELEDLDAEMSFRESNPDLDAEGFAAWLKGKVAPDDLAQMQKEAEGDRTKFLTLAHAKYAEQSGQANTEEPDLPSDINGVAGEKGDLDKGNNLDVVDDDFTSIMGLDK